MKKVKNPKDIVRAKDNSAMSTAFDAFGRTDNGQFIVVEAKNIGPRVTKLRELAHSTIMDMTRTTGWYKKRFYQLMDERRNTKKHAVNHPYDLFKAAKPVLKEIAVNGGDGYKSATMTLQYTWSSHKTLADTVNMILG
jgi:predicted metal-dependent phosphotriesterase family hydrolase